MDLHHRPSDLVSDALILSELIPRCELTLSLTRQFLRGVFLSTYCLSGHLHPPAGTQFDPLSLRWTYLLFLSWTGVHMSSFCLTHFLVVLRLCAQHCAAYTSAADVQLHPLIIVNTVSLEDNDITLPRLWIFFLYHSDVYNSQGLRFPGIADFYAI